MKKTTFNLILFTIILGCSSSVNDDKQIDNKVEQDTLYDIFRGELVHETEDTLWFEPYENKTLKVRNIFKKGKNYIYQATYKDDTGNTLSDNKIKLIPSGERIQFAPERQDRVTYIYENYKEDSIKLASHTLNPTYQRWVNKAEEGIIENVEKVWIHPMRHNQYKFTEVAPFPEIELPLEIGKQWESTLNINNFFGEWANSSGVSEYEVIKRDSFTLKSGQIECWKIKSKSKFPFGISYLNYKFNKDYGFVELNYKNYKNETLEIRLVLCEDEIEE